MTTDQEASPLLEKGDENEELLSHPSLLTRKQKIIASVGCVVRSGICGLTNVAMAANIGQLAENVGKTSVEVGGCFIARAVAAFLGSLLVPCISPYITGSHTAQIGLIAMLAFSLYCMVNTSEYMLYFMFFVSGLSLNIVDIVSVIHVRKLHGIDAGPWMSACFLAFTLSGVLATIIYAVWNNLYFNMGCVGGIILFVYLEMIVFEPDIEEYIAQLTEEVSKTSSDPNANYSIEIICSITLFAALGASANLTSYLETYVCFLDVITTTASGYVLTIYWIGIAISRIAIVIYQTKGVPVPYLMSLFLLCIFICIVVSVLILIFPYNAVVLWIGMIVFGIAIGPAAGIVFGINNLLTTQKSEMSTSILYVGISCANVAPYMVAAIWEHTTLGTYSLFTCELILLVLSFVIVIAPGLAAKSAKKKLSEV